MPPRSPNKNESIVFEAISKSAEDEAYQAEYTNLLELYNQWRRAVELFRAHRDRSLQSNPDVEWMEKAHGPLQLAAAEWAPHPQNPEIFYRLTGAAGPDVDTVLLQEFGPQPDFSGNHNYVPVSIDMKLERKIPDRENPAQAVFEIYEIGDSLRKGKLTGLIAPDIEAHTEGRGLKVLEVGTPEFQDFVDTLDVIERHFGLDKAFIQG